MNHYKIHEFVPQSENYNLTFRFSFCINLQFLIVARIVAHILISSLFGYLYVNVGPTATTVLANYVYMYGTCLLIVYTGKMAVVLSCKYPHFTFINVRIILNECCIINTLRTLFILKKSILITVYIR